MMIRIDARGQACPLPVIKTKKALQQLNEDGAICISVDNAIATQNLAKMAQELGLKIQIQEFSKDHFDVTIMKGAGEIQETVIETAPGTVIVVSTNQMGHGEEALGNALLKSYLFSLTESDMLPEKILFYNTGVYMTTEGADSMEDLMQLQAQGVEIYSCGACLNYYHLQEKLKVGEVTNMLFISNTMLKATKTIHIQ